MLKKYYYLLATLLVCLLFSHTALAATTEGTSSLNDADGIQKVIHWQNYSGQAYDEMSYTELANNGHEYVYKWHINQNFGISGFSGGKFYNGYLTFTINASASIGTVERTTPVLATTNMNDGLYVYIRAVSNTYYIVNVIFDNYYSKDTWVGLPTITQEYFLSMSSQTPTALGVTYAVIDKGTNLRRSDTATDSGFAGMITDAIDNSTALAVIAGWLYDIKDADYTYYQGIISQMSSILSAQNLTNTRLLDMIQEMDLDFQQVQTILDLFPSYRTQVLQYWQELLAMNAAQSSAASEVESEYADKEAQSATLAAGLGQLVLPSVNSNDFNILNQVDSTQKSNFFGLLSIITNNGFITTLLIIVVTGAIVGYILYGKK